MSKRKSKALFYSLIGVVVLAFLLSISLWYLEKNSLDKSSEASEEELLWSFIVMSDTHSVDSGMWDIFYNRVKTHDPVMILHGGDAGWDQTNLTYSDYRYQPLRGLVKLQNGEGITNPVEIHIATGNHDVKTIKQGKNKKFELLKGLRTPACFGEHYYWGDTNQGFWGHHGKNDTSLNPQIKKGIPVFNYEILNSDFCKEGETDMSYSFERGNIKFIIAGWDLLLDSHEGADDKAWLKREICNPPPNISKSILVSHDLTPDRIRSVIGPCENNLSIVFNGHRHWYEKSQHGNTTRILLAGVRSNSRADRKPKDYWNPSDVEMTDYAVAKVYKDKIVIDRYSWYEPDGSDMKKETILTVEGSYSEWESPMRQEANLELKKGFQFLSIPVSVNGLKASELLKMINEQSGRNEPVVTEISSFGGNEINIYSIKEGKDSRKDFDIVPLGGYVVYAEEKSNIRIIGMKNDGVRELKKGWNLTGVSLEGVEKASELISFLNEEGMKVVSVFRYDSRISSYKGYLNVEGDYFGEDFGISSNEAYWVLVE